MKRWYVAQAFAGYEEHIRADIVKRIEEKGLGHLFGQILVPSAKMKQFFDVSDALQDQQLFPGYILVEMDAQPEAIRLVLTTPRISRFLGGKEPVALAPHEVERILGQMRGEVVIASERRQFESGSEVEIIEGPFAGFMGIVSEVDATNEKLKVMVSIFGRMTPVELGYDKVKQ